MLLQCQSADCLFPLQHVRRESIPAEHLLPLRSSTYELHSDAAVAIPGTFFTEFRMESKSKKKNMYPWYEYERAKR